MFWLEKLFFIFENTQVDKSQKKPQK